MVAEVIEQGYSQLRLSPAGFARLARYVTAELGIKMPESKMAMVQSRLLRRVRELNLDSIEEYLDRFFRSSDANPERVHLLDALTTNKTDFFREPQHFEFLVNTVLPSLGVPSRVRFRAWSAGCSSGEEPYSLAMVLSEYAAGNPGFEFVILATDVSTRVLNRAREGIYTESQIDPVPRELRRKYLLANKDRSSGTVRIRPELREKLSVHPLNFMENYQICEMFQVIFFRNVLIYFDKETQEAVVNKICRNLAPAGFLFISHSESLAGLDVPLHQIRTSVFRKRA
jgi:chemotaxis protein methyltransferase CheR